MKISEGTLANGRQQLQAGVNENGGEDEEEESSGEESDDEEEEEVEEEGISTQETDTSGEGDRLNESAWKEPIGVVCYDDRWWFHVFVFHS